DRPERPEAPEEPVVRSHGVEGVEGSDVDGPVVADRRAGDDRAVEGAAPASRAVRGDGVELAGGETDVDGVVSSDGGGRLHPIGAVQGPPPDRAVGVDRHEAITLAADVDRPVAADG